MLGLVEMGLLDLEKKSNMLKDFGRTDVKQKVIRKVYLSI